MAWLGGNEKTVGTEIDDVTFFVRDLARYVQEEDLRHATTTSRARPSSPDDLEPNANEAGNQHPWDAGIKNMEFHLYRQMTLPVFNRRRDTGRPIAGDAPHRAGTQRPG